MFNFNMTKILLIGSGKNPQTRYILTRYYIFFDVTEGSLRYYIVGIPRL